MTTYNIIHKDLTEQEQFKSVQRNHELHPEVAMHPRDWARRRSKWMKKQRHQKIV